jgi:hypothetical protein
LPSKNQHSKGKSKLKVGIQIPKYSNQLDASKIVGNPHPKLQQRSNQIQAQTLASG